MKKFTLMAALSLALAACGRPPDNFMRQTGVSIVGGEPVSKNSPVAHSVVAVVGNDGAHGFLCSGVLISQSAVLTAGHCGQTMRQGEIVFSTDLSPSAPRAAVTGVDVQPKFENTMGRLNQRAGGSPNAIKNWGDLAILHFEGRVPAGASIAQIGDGNSLTDGQSVILAGYGLLDGAAGTQTRTLHAIEVPVDKSRYSTTEFTVAPGACHGDSGGPAFVQKGSQLYVVGITSRGFDGECRTDSIYTKVSAYADWIRTAIE